MIINFEEYTYDLTEDEMRTINLILGAFNPDPSRSITTGDIAAHLSDNHNLIVPTIRIQKLLSAIRKMGVKWSNRMLVGTKHGFFWTDADEYKRSYIKSIIQRMNAELTLAIAGIKQSGQLDLVHYGSELDEIKNKYNQIIQHLSK